MKALEMKLFTHEPTQPTHTRKIDGPSTTAYFIPVTRTRTLFLSVTNRYSPRKIARRITWKIRKAFFSYLEETDCDGTSLLIQDRMTGGKLYTLTQWNYRRASNGYRLHIGPMTYTPENDPPAYLERITRYIVG